MGSDHFWKFICGKSPHSLWREAHLEVKSVKSCRSRAIFGSCDVEKVRGAVARSTFGSEKWQSTPCSEQFWTLRCWKSEHSCRVKHIWKWKVLKTVSLRPFLDFLEVQMSKTCTRWWREAHVEVESIRNWRIQPTFGRSDVVWLKDGRIDTEIDTEIDQIEMSFLAETQTDRYVDR